MPAAPPSAWPSNGLRPPPILGASPPLMGPGRLGRLFRVSDKGPVNRVAGLRAGFDAMVADPGFRAEAQRMKLLVTPMTGDEVARHIAELYATPSDVVARAKTILGD